MTRQHIIASTVCLALMSGCSTLQESPDPEFGTTVRSVLNSQIHDYEAAIHPSPDAVEGSDPYRLDAVLEAYRGDVAEGERVQQPISISIGNSN